MRNWIALLLALCMAAICGSCYRQEDFNRDMFADSGFEYDVAIPLTDTRLTMANLMDLKGGLFVPDDTSLLHIIYSIEPVRTELMEVITFGQVSPFILSVSDVPYKCIKDTLITIPFSDTIYFDMQGVDAQIKTLYFSAALLAMNTQNNFLFPMELEMSFGNVKNQDGTPLVYRNQTPEASRKDTLVNMNDIQVQMNEDQKAYIVLSGAAKVHVNRVEGDNELHQGSLYVAANFKEMEFWRADGYFDKASHRIEGEMPIGGLALERMKNISFEEACIIADIDVNGVSAPLRFAQTEVAIHNMEGGKSIVPLFPANYDVACPAVTDNPLSKQSRESTEVGNLLIDRPYAVTYTLDALLNPENDKTNLQAMQQGSYIAIGLTCDVPLHFSADHYALRDTLEVSLDALPENTELLYFDVKSIIKNAFPLDVVFSLHFLDAEYKSLISLFHDDLIGGGKVGPAPGLHVEEPTVATFEDKLDMDDMALVRQARYVMVDAKISTTDQQKVKVYVDGEKEGFVEAKIGVRVKIRQKGLLGN